MLSLFRPKPPPEVTATIKRLTSELTYLLGREVQSIRALGLPDARESSPLRFSTGARTRSELRITLPRYDLPSYRSFSVLESERRTIHPNLEENGCYVLSSEGGFTLSEAERLFETEGLPAVLNQHPNGLWTNRDPYGLYKFLSGREGTGYDDKLISPAQWGVSELYAASDEGMRKVVYELPTRLELFYNATEGLDEMSGMEIEEMAFIFQWARPYNPKRAANVPGWIYRTVLERLRVPTILRPALARSLTYKILPSEATPARQMVGLLDALRFLRKPILFSLTQEDGRVSFAMTCEEGDAAGLDRQLSLHYPTFTIQKVDYPPSLSLDGPFSLHLHPALPHERVRELSALPLDPLLHLLTGLDDSPEEPFMFEVGCVPLAGGALAPLEQFFGNWYEQFRNKEALRRGKLIADKSPAWAMRLTLAGTSQAQISAIHNTFLKPLSTYEQPLILSDPEKEASPSWGLVTTGELASFVHFPLFDPKRTRIEGGGRTGQPPKEYTIE